MTSQSPTTMPPQLPLDASLSTTPPQRYWVGVASRNHVERGVEGGFCQLCHGKAPPLARMRVGDWIVYYSPKETFEGNVPCQSFTAIGQVVGEAAYQHEMFAGFVPWRRDVRFVACHDAPIRPLLARLSFIQDKSRWGYAFRFGHLSVSREDFMLIANSMLDTLPDTLTNALAA